MGYLSEKSTFNMKMANNKLQVHIITITQSKENNSIHRLDVSGLTGPGGQLPTPPPPSYDSDTQLINSFEICVLTEIQWPLKHLALGIKLLCRWHNVGKKHGVFNTGKWERIFQSKKSPFSASVTVMFSMEEEKHWKSLAHNTAQQISYVGFQS